MHLKALNWYKNLSQSRHRRSESLFLVEGKRAVEQILALKADFVVEILISKDHYPEHFNNYTVRRIEHVQMKKICTASTPQGVAAVVRIPQDTYSCLLPQQIGTRILLLEHVQDPGNVGTLIRTAAALGYDGCLLSDKCADPFSPKSIQSTAGSVLSVWIRRSDRYMEMLTELKEKHFTLVAAGLGGTEVIDFSNFTKHVIALGSEGSGLSSDLLTLCDSVFRIPMVQGAAESLNVGASGAICMFMGAQGLMLQKNDLKQE
ncbi:RNA methyltransferase [Chitinispirillales bacterium ANBcel5]|uniref:TrmH family RNA methyltransferase n=1 Tax=Cellulosispirillum alkaliphilum TaxID=3039283 RepID=UPI002A53785E|nr:RNA methyltransferase [Chitinispirillales bacterium ANBcel5]